MSGDLRRLAKGMAAELLEQVVEESRRQATEVVRERLTAALVEEMVAGLADLGEPRRSPRDAATASTAESRSGWYVYGITWAGVAGGVAGDKGIDGASVESLAAGPVAAVVSPVSTSGRWGVTPGGELDVGSLAPRARDHERVLEQVLERGPVLPLRFGVMYPTLDRVRRALDDNTAAIEGELRRLAGFCEWGLTVRAGPEPDPPREDLAPVRDINAGSGRNYLDRRRKERDAAEELRSTMGMAAERIHDSLLAVACDAVVLPSGGPQAGAEDRPVMRAAYLVASEGTDGFRAAAEAAMGVAPPELGLTGELTGPWPPYHFSDVCLDAMEPA